MRLSRKPNARGFTLIELMVVVVVIGILSAIAYPAYNNYRIKAGRAQGKVRLVQAAQLLERYYTECNTYDAAPTTGPCNGNGRTFNAIMGVTGATVYSGADNEVTSAYVVTVATNNQTFTLTATPQTLQTADTLCGTLTLTNTGVKGESGTGAVTDCW